MELIRGLQNLKPEHRGCVASIGNYDGVHVGHQSIIRQLQGYAKNHRVPCLVIIFEPQPQEYFARGAPPARLSTLREKLELLQRCGIDRVLCLRFNAALARMSALDFVHTILMQGLDVRHLVVGADFRFGHGREGDLALLQALGDRCRFDVEQTVTSLVDGTRVSSTRIRDALASGRFADVEAMLGRPYSISGRVAHGDGMGRTWGFPTANLPLKRRRSPLSGVFAVEVSGLAQRPLAAVANLGRRPTVDGTRVLLEVHLLDFDRDIYGRRIAVTFRHKFRDEQRFASVEALRKQIADDKRQAQAYFAAAGG
jgi:riboflavin kinase/FMN adenylyltransferase